MRLSSTDEWDKWSWSYLSWISSVLHFSVLAINGMINLYHCDCVCVTQPNLLLLEVVYVCGNLCYDHCTIITQAFALHHLLVDKTRIRHAKQKVPRCCMHLHKRTQEQQGLMKEKERCLWIHFKGVSLETHRHAYTYLVHTYTHIPCSAMSLCQSLPAWVVPSALL